MRADEADAADDAIAAETEVNTYVYTDVGVYMYTNSHVVHWHACERGGRGR